MLIGKIEVLLFLPIPFKEALNIHLLINLPSAEVFLPKFIEVNGS